MSDFERIIDDTNRNEEEAIFSMLPVSDDNKEISKTLKNSNNREELDHRQQQCSNDTDSHSESSWNIIIVNQIPLDSDPDEFMTIFSEYGEIIDFYHFREFARITFATEEEARKVWEASQERPFRYYDDIVVVTLFSDDYCPIESLPADCLVQIFLRVNDGNDKLTLESVSNRWKTLSEESWTNFTEANFIGSVNNSITARAKNRIQTVHLHLDEFEDVEQFKELARTCTRLEKFIGYFSNFINYGKYGVSQLAQAFNSLLRVNKHLRHLELHLSEIDELTLDFSSISKQLEYLKIARSRDCSKIFQGIVDLSCYQNLQVLILQEMPEEVTYEVKGFESLVNLKTFALLDDCNLSNLLYFSDIEKVKSLENLALSGCYGTDDKLKKILQNNKKLKCIDIRRYKYATDESFKYIQQLLELKILSIPVVHRVTEEYFANMPTVESVYAGDRRITDSGMKRFLDTACEIRLLDVYNTDVTLKCISIARDWTRRTGKSLSLFVSDVIYQAYQLSDIATDDKLSVHSGSHYWKQRIFDW